MKTKKLLAIGTLFSIIVFFTLLSLLWIISQATTGIPNETRKEVIIHAISGLQAANGSFVGIYETNNKGVPHTSVAITILTVLTGLDRIDLEKAVNYIVSMQNTTTGGFPDDYLIYGELYNPWDIVNALKSINQSSRLHRNLVDFVMQRYNETDGAFHEPTFELYGKNVAWCHFAMMGWGHQEWAAYGKSNVVSTFLAVDILKNLGALNRINTTRTIGWILSCKAGNGGFGPFPMPHGEPYYPYISDNPFFVDSEGAGIAFTYAAVGALKDLGFLNTLTSDEIESIRNYVLSCQSEEGYFAPNADAVTGRFSDDTIFHTYYAITTLQYLNSINQPRENIAKAESWLLSQQDFKNKRTYGLFEFAEGGTYDAVLSLNAFGDLYLLDELTPRAIEQRTLILSVSTALASTTFIITLATSYAVKWKTSRKQAKM